MQPSVLSNAFNITGNKHVILMSLFFHEMKPGVQNPEKMLVGSFVMDLDMARQIATAINIALKKAEEGGGQAPPSIVR